MSNSVPIVRRPYRLQNPIRHYEWGERGPSAFIAKLLRLSAPEPVPYAELWVGAHLSAPSILERPDGPPVPLLEAVRMWPVEIMGTRVTQSFGGAWPFLFKILSAAEPLSIQSHPDRIQAVALHRRHPHDYPDPNPKPEIAVAVDRFRALAGFKPVKDWQTIFRTFPEIGAFVDSDSLPARQEEDFLKSAFHRLLSKAQKSPEELARVVEKTANRMAEGPRSFAAMAELFHKLLGKYGPTDVGLIVLLFLNPLELSPGEAVFLPPGLPHAYLGGNIVECMANSDNVVRLGLTPKPKDFEALLEVLDFRPHRPSVIRPQDVHHTVYRVPCDAFQLHRWTLEPGRMEHIGRPDGPEILFILEGCGHIFWDDATCRSSMPYDAGQAFLMPAVLLDYDLGAQARTVAFSARVPVVEENRAARVEV